jgi:hemoglobin
MMAGRHAAFKITPEARMIWLESYIMVLKDLDMPDDLKQSFWNYLDIFSIWMVNTPQD